MDEQFKVLLRLLKQGDAFDKTLTYAGLVASAVGALVALWVGKDYAFPWWIAAGIGVVVFLVRIAWLAADQIYKLQDAARPKLIFGTIVETERPYQLHGTRRKFEIEVINDSDETLNECCVNLIGIVGNDGSLPCVEQLPRSLLTRANEERGGEGRFRLRPKQPKFIVLCLRADGGQQEISFGYEGNTEPYWSFSTVHSTDLTVTLIAYGAPNPPSIALRLRVDAGRLHVVKRRTHRSGHHVVAND